MTELEPAQTREESARTSVPRATVHEQILQATKADPEASVEELSIIGTVVR